MPTTSGASGRSVTDAYDFTPWISSYRGFTGYTLTRSDACIAAARNRPPYCIRGVAPTTAIERGFNMRSMDASCASVQKVIVSLPNCTQIYSRPRRDTAIAILPVLDNPTV